MQVDGLQLFEQGRDLVVFVLIGQFAGKPLLAEIPDNKDAHQLATVRAGRHERQPVAQVIEEGRAKIGPVFFEVGTKCLVQDALGGEIEARQRKGLFGARSVKAVNFELGHRRDSSNRAA